MVFKWKVIRPAYRDRVDGLELLVPGVECDFETGSPEEAHGLFEGSDVSFTRIFGGSILGKIEMTAAELAAAPDAAPKTETAAPDVAPKRGRPRKPAVEAVAPDPVPVPVVGAEVPTEDPTTAAAALAGPVAAAPSPEPQPAPSLPAAPPPAEDGGIPPFLQRVAAPPIAAAPALPALPKAAAPPPVGVLGPKVVKALDAIKANAAAQGKDDGGQALSDWLAEAGLTIKGKTYDDACRAVLMISDEKITAAGVLVPLGIATAA